MIDTSSAIRNITVIVAAALLLGAGSVALASDGDFHYWSEASFLVPIRDDWQFKYEPKFDFEDEGRRLGYQEHDYGFVYSGLADELFYKLDSRRFSGQRFYAGFYVPLAETIRLELFYLWYLYDDDHWHDTNVLGSHLRFTF